MCVDLTWNDPMAYIIIIMMIVINLAAFSVFSMHCMEMCSPYINPTLKVLLCIIILSPSQNGVGTCTYVM